MSPSASTFASTTRPVKANHFCSIPLPPRQNTEDFRPSVSVEVCVKHYICGLATCGGPGGVRLLMSDLDGKTGDDYQYTCRGGTSLFSDIPRSSRCLRGQCPMESQSHFGRLEYSCQLDANDCPKWARRCCDIRSFKYYQCLHLGEYRGQWHHLYPGRNKSLFHHSASQLNAHP